MSYAFTNKHLKEVIKSEFGTLTKFKKFLKDNAKLEYGCKSFEYFMCGCKFTYTDNKNCFAKYIITIIHNGMKKELALGKSSLNKPSEQYLKI